MGLSDIRTSTITSKGQIVIPGEIRLNNGFKPGQKVAILSFPDHLEIRPLGAVAEKINWEEEDKKIREAAGKFIEKHPHLKKIKKWELPKEEEDRHAREYFERKKQANRQE